jgi:ribosome-interacting GTPase 1
MSAEAARLILKEYKVTCCDLILREDITVDQLIDVIEGNRKYMPILYVMNKIDQLTIEELDILDELPNYVPISSSNQWNIEDLMEEIWDRTSMLRIYTKPRGQAPDYEEPIILHATNPTVEQFVNRIHRTLMDSFSYAWVWGKSAKFQPQRCGREHVLMDEDIVQIVKKSA